MQSSGGMVYGPGQNGTSSRAHGRHAEVDPNEMVSEEHVGSALAHVAGGFSCLRALDDGRAYTHAVAYQCTAPKNMSIFMLASSAYSFSAAAYISQARTSTL